MCGCVSVGGGSVAESSVVVDSPAPECVVVFGGARMTRAGADVVPCVASDLCGCVSVGGGSVAESTGIVVAPAPECVVGFGGAGMA